MELRRKSIGFVLFTICVTTVGCHKPLPNPELVDPIYLDLRDESDRAAKAVAEQEGAIKTLQKEREHLESTAPHDLELKRVLAEMRAETGKLERLQQRAEFYRIRVETRKAHSRDRYSSFFGTDREGEWLSKEEIELYKTQKRLQGASRKWADRVPKANFVGKKGDQKKEKADKSGSGGGHH